VPCVPTTRKGGEHNIIYNMRRTSHVSGGRRGTRRVGKYIIIIMGAGYYRCRRIDLIRTRTRSGNKFGVTAGRLFTGVTDARGMGERT